MVHGVGFPNILGIRAFTPRIPKELSEPLSYHSPCPKPWNAPSDPALASCEADSPLSCTPSEFGPSHIYEMIQCPSFRIAGLRSSKIRRNVSGASGRREPPTLRHENLHAFGGLLSMRSRESTLRQNRSQCSQCPHSTFDRISMFPSSPHSVS